MELLNLVLVSFFIGLLVFCSKRKHLLLALLSLEYLVLTLYFFIMISSYYFGYEFFFSMIFLTLTVCEGALGLSVLVSLIRTHGNDYFKSFSVLW
uniref:NADH dehydrogenase subunit 4L n=1 Tax=Meliboeus sinae TaxID=2946727 RepID=UPI0020794B60|nr:NADH dehydrogenase subunit 4L [Meliboeus sinae]URN73098.1 NADH dehydrogenase subunit 4L [Meliboeus sinae]